MKRFRAAIVILACFIFVFGVASKRRAVAQKPCPTPSLIFVGPTGIVCAGTQVTISWASDAKAVVSITGIGSNLPSTGSRTFPVTGAGAIVYSASATNACGKVTNVSLSIQSRPDSSAEIAIATPIAQGNTVSATVVTHNSTDWSLGSSLGNTFHPTSGVGDGTFGVAYEATRAGIDALTLNANGPCGAKAMTLGSVDVRSSNPPPPPPPPPPPGGGYLRCCDGTLSPTCTNCASKQGCCSHHGGVCGC